jgi:HlyD family secretion protein
MKKKLSLVLTVVVVLAVLAGAGLYVRKLWTARPAEPKYVTEEVGPKKIVGKITASGTLSALKTVQVGSQVSGRIESLSADFNTNVKKGDIVARLDPQLFEAAVKQARANASAANASLKKAESEAKLAKAQLERTRGLRAQGIASAADLESAESAAAVADASILSARAQIEQADAALSQAQVNLSYTKIASPVDGVVISRNVDVGQTVAASLSAPVLFTIAEDLGKMQIDTSVAEGDIGRVSVGMKASFTVDAFTGETFSGKIREVRNSPQTVQNVVTYDAVIEVENPEHKLRPGMTANVTIVYQEADAKLAVPNAALRFRPPLAASSAAPSARPPRTGGGNGGEGDKPKDRRTVWVLRGDAPAAVRVKTGLTDGTTTEIVEGDLAPGDKVITDTTSAAGAASSKQGSSSSPFRTGGGRMF